MNPHPAADSATAARLLAELGPGQRIYIPGATGEPLALRDLLAAQPQAARDVRFISCLVPGMNDFDYAALQPTSQMTTFLMPPAIRKSYEAGRVRVLPLAYSQIAVHLEHDAAIDTAFFQVAPPGPDGRCSVGICADFAALAWRGAKRRIAVINPSMPAMRRGPSLALADFDLTVELDGPVMTAATAATTAEVAIIADRVAALTPDGAAVQTGIGGAPGAVLDRLTDHRNLVMRSGMVGDAVQALAEAGALDPDGVHITGIAYGSADFYRFLAESDLLTFADTSITHGAASLASVERLVSINSALEVDLFGQANLEWRGERLISGVGGAPDFVRAAGRSPGGLSIIALPSTAGGGNISRIVPRLTSPTVAIGRNDIDTVVTEHGAARLRNLSMDERAKALIAIADPRHQDALAADWAALRTRL